MNTKLALFYGVVVVMFDYSITASIDNSIIPSNLAKNSESKITPPEVAAPEESIPNEHLREILKTAEKSLQNITHIVNSTSLFLDGNNGDLKDAANDSVVTDDTPRVPLLTDLLEFLDKENRQVYSILQSIIKQIRSRLPFQRPNQDN